MEPFFLKWLARKSGGGRLINVKKYAAPQGNSYITLANYLFMQTIFLSGVGGSTNWLPLVFPLVAIVIALKGGELLMKTVKKRKLLRENQLIEDLSAGLENTKGTVSDKE